MTTPNSSLTRIAIPLAMTMALGPLALDAYLPAFPAIASDFDVPVHDIALSISIYVFLLAFGQLVGGPLSDRFGRAQIMTLGLILFGIASFLITRVESLGMFLVLRAIQAFGGGWATVCVPAIVRDRLSGQAAARFFSLIGLIVVAAPALAPSIGSLLLSYLGWASIFYFLAGYALMMVGLVKLFILRLPTLSSTSAAEVSTLHRYLAVIAKKAAMRFLILQALAFSTMLLFITHSPFIYQQHFGVSPATFGLLFGANIVLMFLMNLINRRLLLTHQSTQILKWGFYMQTTGVFLGLISILLLPTLWLFVPAMMITVGSMGAITANTQACYMEFYHEHGGTASALIGAATFAIGGIISASSAILPESVLSIVLAQAACVIVCLCLARNLSVDTAHPEAR